MYTRHNYLHVLIVFLRTCSLFCPLIVQMIGFLVDNIFVQFGGRLFQQTVGIPISTNWAPLLADLFIYSYEADFLDGLLKEKQKKLAHSFNFSFRYFDDVLCLNSSRFEDLLHLIYLYIYKSARN